ncbi:MAG: threonine/serine exporter family protein, partial [Selenomonas sp.]|nr:threonine/serine exporter family protein [Selenomonas sp.]
MTKRETDVAQNDLDVIIETGTILMEGGAEIYRVEETMRHMAAALQMTDFSAYVVNRGIIA